MQYANRLGARCRHARRHLDNGWHLLPVNAKPGLQGMGLPESPPSDRTMG